MDKKERLKKGIRIIILSMTVFIVVAAVCAIVLKNAYGTFSIPHWIRPTHDALNNVHDYHSNLKFPEPENSLIPRIDIVMDDDYRLSKDKFTKCVVQITNAEEYNLDASEAKIRIRGNSTQSADKKPYKIKFADKVSLFGGGKEKSWVLLANVNDTTGLHNYISMEMYKHLAAEGTFVPMVKIVNLYINGDYQGVYNLCDQVETGDTRVPISDKIKDTPENTDYLMVHDSYAYYKGNAGEEGIGWFWLDKTFTPIEIKSPDTEDQEYTEEYSEYLKKRLDYIYDVILSKDWEAINEVVDVDSFIDGYMVSIIANNEDIAYKSIYYYLPAGGKLTYGPVWDMDLTFGAGTSNGYKSKWGEKVQYNYMWRKLMEVPEFKEAFIERFEAISPEIEELIYSRIDEAVSYAGKDLENEFNNRKEWGRRGEAEYKESKSYDEAIDYMKRWTHERLDYLNEMYKKD